MRFRRLRAGRWLRATVPLEPRGIYHLSGEVRHEWQHSIIAIDRTRFSVTFRSFSTQGRKLVQAGADQRGTAAQRNQPRAPAD